MLAGFGYLGLIALTGWVILGFFKDLGRLERIALAYGLGAGIHTFLTFLAASIGLPVSLPTGAVIALVLLMGAFGLQRRQGSSVSTRNIIVPTHFSAFEAIGVGIIGAIVVASFFLAWYWPPFAWDAITEWLLVGKLIAGGQSLQSALATGMSYYPLNVPLQAAFLYLLGGDFVQAPFPVYFLSLLLMIYANLERQTGRAIALACILFLSATPIFFFQSIIAYANLPFAFYYAGSAIYLYRHLDERKVSWLALSSILIGLCGWTRATAPLYFGINLVVLILFSIQRRGVFKPLLLYLGTFASVAVIWIAFANKGYAFYPRFAAGGLIDILSGNLDLNKVVQITRYFVGMSLVSSDWGVLWLAFPLAIWVGWRNLRHHASLIILIGLNMLGLLYMFYTNGGDPSTLAQYLYIGFDRNALHFAPLVVYYLGLAIASTPFKAQLTQTLSSSKVDYYLILLFFLLLVAIVPLGGSGYFWDARYGRFAVYSLFEFDRVFQDGILYPRWAPDFTFGYGYPFFNLSPPGVFFVGEMLHRLGWDFVAATKGILGLALVLSGPAMYGFVKRWTHSAPAAFLSAVAYVYIPYHLAGVYARAAVAESVALVFLPLTLWGLYEIVIQPRRVTFVAAAAAYGALIFTHLGVALFFTPLLGAWVLILMVAEGKKKNLLISASRKSLASFVRLGLPALAAIILGMGIAAIFLLPFALESQFVRVDQWMADPQAVNHLGGSLQFLNPPWSFDVSLFSPRDGITFQVGLAPALLALLSIAAVVRNPRGTRWLWLFFVGMFIAVVGLLFQIPLPVWETFRLFNFGYFPWQLLALMLVAVAVLGGAIALVYDKAGGENTLSLPTLVLALLIVLGSLPYLIAQMSFDSEENPVSIVGLMRLQQNTGEMIGATTSVKEIPNWSPMADVYFAGKNLKSKIDYTDIDPDKLWIGVLPNLAGFRTDGERIVYHAPADTTITFNISYYPGWRAYLVKPQTTEIVQELQVEVADERGRIAVHLPKGQEQWLMLRFDDTPARAVGAWISAASLLLALGLLIAGIRVDPGNERASEGNAPFGQRIREERRLE